MAEGEPTPSQTAEKTEEQTLSSERDDVVQSVDELKQSDDDLDGGSSILFDEREPRPSGLGALLG